MNIGFDIDGVLTNFEKFQLEMGKEYFKGKYDVVNPNGFTLSEIFGCTEKEEKMFWTQNIFKYSIGLKAREGVSELTKSLHNSGDNIKLITSRLFCDKNNASGKLMRYIVEEWAKSNGIEHDGIVFCGDDKTDAIIDNKIDIMFEDSPKDIINLGKLTDVICVDASYNKQLKDVRRIYSIKDEALSEILKIKNEKAKNEINKRMMMEIKPLSGKASIDRPWLKYYSYDERNIKLPELTLYQYLTHSNNDNLNRIALKYFNSKITFKELFNNIDKYAKSFQAMGVKNNDIVTLCLPNVPEAVYMVYALNKLGAVANMIHPLKSANEIKDFLNEADSKLFVTIDNAYEEVNKIIDETSVKDAVVVSAGDSLPMPLKVLYKAKNKMNIDYENGKYLKLSDFLSKSKTVDKLDVAKYEKDKVAVIIHTGGSTGFPKGVQLTNDNFNCMVHQQRATAKNFGAGDTMLTIMPVFHGFGLCSSIHMPLSYGITTVLIPKFDAKDFSSLIKKYKPNHIFGVPKLWKAFINDKDIDKMDLSFIRYVVSGGENLKNNLEEDIDKFLLNHNCSFKLKKGYGLSEAVAGTTLSDDYSNEIGSVGVPLVCNDFKVVKPGTQEELDYNEEGEFCVSGPTVMKGYYNNPEETNNSLKVHDDGKTWLHTGDMGYMTEDGMLYYTDRLTRMYVSAGYNIYPPRIEKTIESVDGVLMCAVVPMKHPSKDVKVPKAYVVMRNDAELNDEVKNNIIEACKNNLDMQHQPYQFEQISEFPLTNMGNDMGKVDYKTLEKLANDSKVNVKKG